MKKSYFIFLGAFLLFCSSFTLTYNAFAGVYFITRPDRTFDDIPRGGKACQLLGYTVLASTCTDGKEPTLKCPNGNFYKSCQCNIYKLPWNNLNCTGNKILGGKNCADTYYETCSCDPKFAYDTTTCPSPKLISGESCDGKQEACNCPTEYSQTCTGNFVPKNILDSCNGKYRECLCDPNVFKSCDYGGQESATKCEDASGELYSSCRTEPLCETGEVFWERFVCESTTYKIPDEYLN
ncbi:MAG: hypothetical protein PHE89_07645 [Alphaproteobacteria bacterium]|nr:hypothetical protein [Alphaproteobacteria bacterium]